MVGDPGLVHSAAFERNRYSVFSGLRRFSIRLDDFLHFLPKMALVDTPDSCMTSYGSMMLFYVPLQKMDAG
jgi:hypothetical protein